MIEYYILNTKKGVLNMNVLLIFFAIPVAIIILSIILERYLKCPISVAGIFFSIFLVVAFVLGAIIEYIVATFVYTIISFLTALLYEYIRSRNSCKMQCLNCPFYNASNTNRCR